MGEDASSGQRERQVSLAAKLRRMVKRMLGKDKTAAPSTKPPEEAAAELDEVRRESQAAHRSKRDVMAEFRSIEGRIARER